MIQFKRGSTEINNSTVALDEDTKAGTWKDVVLQDGQPGYDRTTNRLKIGDGVNKWQLLPWLKSGLEKQQILDSESNARDRLKANSEDTTIFTYGSEDPLDASKFVGEVYLHQYDGSPEADYIIDSGKYGDWYYEKKSSGNAECWCSIRFPNKSIVNKYGDTLFKSDYIGWISYPPMLNFIETPSETVTVMPERDDGDDSIFVNTQPIFASIGQTNTKQNTCALFVCGHTKETSIDIIVNFQVKGKVSLDS